MRHFWLCAVVLALDVAFALSGSKTLVVPAFSQAWAGVPVSVWTGLCGIVFLVLLTVAISLLAFPAREPKT
jgi:hypothetical protein